MKKKIDRTPGTYHRASSHTKFQCNCPYHPVNAHDKIQLHVKAHARYGLGNSGRHNFWNRGPRLLAVHWYIHMQLQSNYHSTFIFGLIQVGHIRYNVMLIYLMKSNLGTPLNISNE